MLLTTRSPKTSTSAMTFPEFLDHLLVGGERGTRSYALDHGVDETALIRYANGAVSAYERAEITAVISRNAWAKDFVVQVVKQKRKQQAAA